MNIQVSGILQGAVTPPPSKSQAHRLLICAALGSAQCRIMCSAVNKDIMATMKSLCAIGADINYSNGVFTINPMDLKKNRTLDCGESGSTMRFLVPVAAALGADATFVGSGKLPQRPMKDLCIAL